MVFPRSQKPKMSSTITSFCLMVLVQKTKNVVSIFHFNQNFCTEKLLAEFFPSKSQARTFQLLEGI